MKQIKEKPQGPKYGLTDDYKTSDVCPERPRKIKKPITSDMYGTYDYYFEDYLAGYVLHPVSEAAITWCENELHEHMPRYGIRGYILNAVEKAAIEAALINRDMKGRDDD